MKYMGIVFLVQWENDHKFTMLSNERSMTKIISMVMIIQAEEEMLV